MSLPYYGGMRHINITPGSFDQACGEIRNMREDEVGKVMEFISRLKAERRDGDKKAVGSSGLISRHVGRFSFNEGERENLLKMALEAREVGLK